MGICGKYLSDRLQSARHNVQTSNWSQIQTGFPKGSILGPLLFAVYINDLPEGLTSNVKLFADDTLIFSVVHDLTSSSLSLNGELSKTSQ